MKKRDTIKPQDRIDPSYALTTTNQKLTSQCGLLVFIKVVKALWLKQLAAALFPNRREQPWLLQWRHFNDADCDA